MHRSIVFYYLTLLFEFTGDSGYACTPYMLTPFVERDLTAGQQAYNRAHKATRVMIERAFGELKSRFRCLNNQGI